MCLRLALPHSVYCSLHQAHYQFTYFFLMDLHLFGASSPVGEALRQQFSSLPFPGSLFSYSRSDLSSLRADFNDPSTFYPGGDPNAPCVWVSFAPIWLLAPFLDHLSLRFPERLRGLRYVFACSSSSVITKRYAVNSFDRELVTKLNHAEDLLIATCKRHQIHCTILRPTLIYGRVGGHLDRNLSRLISLMRWLPLLPIPSRTGLRQPIHARQLASVVLAIFRQFIAKGFDTQLSQRISVGGDSVLSYFAMLRAMQLSLPHTDPARHCLLLPMPTRLFQAAAFPLLLFYPKVFEALLRISADLSGFTPSHHFLSGHPEDFPVLPII